MIRFIFILSLVLFMGVGYFAYSAQAKPAWAKSEQNQQKTVQALKNKIEKQGVNKFLGEKFAQVMSGRLVLSDTEFTALVNASLLRHKNGRRLLSVTDSVGARSFQSGLQVNAVVNVDKVEKADPKAKEVLDAITRYVPVSGQKLYLSVKGEPVARNGQIGFTENVSVTIGTITLPAEYLKQLGVPLHEISKQSLPLKNLRIKSVATRNGEVEFGVTPKF